MRSLTISMPALTVFESNYTRKKQVRLFARINNRIDLKIMNYAIGYLEMYEGQSKNNEPKSLLAIFVAIKSKVIHQKKAQG